MRGRLPRGARALLAIAAASARQSLGMRAEILGRVAFYAAILLIYSRLWRAVPMPAGSGDPAAMLWYLAVTEWVLISLPSVHLEIERDVRTGDVAYLLPRPVSYLGAKLAEGAGQAAVRLGTLGLVGFPLAFALAGGLPADPRGLPLALALGLLASAFGLLAHAAIGTTAVWIQDVSPVYWIWQKSAFVLGGLILPLSLYPAWIRGFAAWTPFSALLYGPGSLAFGLDLAGAARSAALLVGWGLVAAAALSALWRRGLRVLDVNGG